MRAENIDSRQINREENPSLVVSLFARLRKSLSHLVDDVDAVVQLLPLEEGMQIVEQELEVVLSVPVGDDDGRAMPGLAVGRPVASSPYHQRVLPLHLSQSESRREADVDRPACGEKSTPSGSVGKST